MLRQTYLGVEKEEGAERFLCDRLSFAKKAEGWTVKTAEMGATEGLAWTRK